MGCSGDGHAHGGSECERSTRRGVKQPDGPLKARAGGRGAPSVLDEAHLSFGPPPPPTGSTRPNALPFERRTVAWPTSCFLEFLVGIWRVGMIQQLCRWPFHVDFHLSTSV